jgi:hypothetical protein
VVDGRLPRQREVKLTLHALLEDAIAELLVERVLRRHVIKDLVEGLGVVLHHALDLLADAHADGRHAVERKRVHVIVRHHDERVGLSLHEAVAHLPDGVHGLDDLLPTEVTARRPGSSRGPARVTSRRRTRSRPSAPSSPVYGVVKLTSRIRPYRLPLRRAILHG